MKNVRKAGSAVEGAEASGKEAAGGRTAKGAAKTSSGRRSAASLLARLGLHGPDDLVLHLPLRYEDETRLVPIGSLVHGSSAQIQATVTRAEVTRGRRALQVWVNDGTGELQLRFLHFYPSQLTQLQPGRLVRAYGELRVGLFGREMVHPRYRMVSEDTPLPDRLTPVYPTAAGLGQATLRREIDRALADCRWQDTLPPTLLTALMSGSGAGKPASGRLGADPVASLLAGLPPLLESLRLIHHPPPGTDLDALLERRTPACQRIVLEELVAQQLSLRRARQLRAGQRGQPLANRDGEAALLASLPFALTGAQRRVCDEIAADLARQQPMNRLLQGDVGSGKTVIAALAAMVAVGSGWQATLMAPTEILARQHYERLSPWLEPLGVRVGWLAGSLGVAAKRRVKQAVAAGEVDVLIGTHALIEDSVVFPRLALAIVDEQHRFGVEQRDGLRGTDGALPHRLVMTATPIPRTVAMTVFGDLDVSVLDTLPAGRQKISTHVVPLAEKPAWASRLWRRAREEIDAGHQVYVVVPKIGEDGDSLEEGAAFFGASSLNGAGTGAGAGNSAQGYFGQGGSASSEGKVQLTSVASMYSYLSAEDALVGVRIGTLHGRMDPAEKTAVMTAFERGEIDLLISTTVIEVGVNVPNATLMIIMDADRFGISGLHQLRGRVGRGGYAGTCLLVTRQEEGGVSRERLDAVASTTDGFELSRIDLAQRREGDILGAAQSGSKSTLRFLRALADADIIERAREDARSVVEKDPTLAKHPSLARTIDRALDADREAFLGRG